MKKAMQFPILLMLLVLMTGCAAEKPEVWTPVRGMEQTAVSELAAVPAVDETMTAYETISELLTETPVTETDLPYSEPSQPVSEAMEISAVEAVETDSNADSDVQDRAQPDEPAEPDETEPEGESLYRYVANKKTKKFHLPSCASVTDMKEENKLYFNGTREELIEQGYVPCKRCNP